jgi:hypothetical protein
MYTDTREKKPRERFWSKVDKSGECWNWTAGKMRDGYGQFTIGNHRSEHAHRVAWRLTNGEIPDGMQVLHRCDNRKCVNPVHLFLGTNNDNMRDKAIKNRGGKLSVDDVRWLREWGAKGWPQRLLAAVVGCSQTHASGIIRLTQRKYIV